MTFANDFDGDSSPLVNRVGYGGRDEDTAVHNRLVFYVYRFDELGSPEFDGREVRIYVSRRSLRRGNAIDLAQEDAAVHYIESDENGNPRMEWISAEGKIKVLGVQGNDPLNAQIRLENVRLVPAIQLGIEPGTTLSGSIEIHTGPAPV